MEVIQFKNPNAKPVSQSDYDYLKKFITDYLNRDRSTSPLSIASIINTVYDHMGCDVSLIKSKSRDSELIVRPRQVTHYFLKKLTKLSLAQIGEKAGNKDHATILNSVRAVNNLMFSDKSFKAMIEEIEKLLTKN
jgi:chromosomal replication initiator protein